MNVISKVDRILVLSPHTDDGELGAGGTIARLVDEGKMVVYIAFSGCEASVPCGLPVDSLRIECKQSTETLGILPNNLIIMNYEVRTFPIHRQEILDDMIKLKIQYNPDLVLTPSSCDTHQDHTTIYWESLRAFKKEASIWGYEHPWNNLTFTTDLFVRLQLEHVDRKIKSLQRYVSQQNRIYMKENNLRALVCTHGAQLDAEYAEAFELIRGIY
jgi:N-acetylglucosamine malate deacetylase 1